MANGERITASECQLIVSEQYNSSHKGACSYVQLSFQCWQKERQNGVISKQQIMQFSSSELSWPLVANSQQWPSTVETSS